MKIRNGFVSNSSSSSFVIGSNENFHDTLEHNFAEWFPAEHERTKEFIKLLAEEMGWEFECYDHHETITSWKSYVDHYRNSYGDWNEEIPKEEVAFYKPLFDKWKYVHFVSIPSSGDGGTRLSAALRYSFPKEFISDKCEVYIDNEG